jgi:hypothetical protein
LRIEPRGALQLPQGHRVVFALLRHAAGGKMGQRVEVVLFGFGARANRLKQFGQIIGKLLADCGLIGIRQHEFGSYRPGETANEG